ncbi:MAG: metal-dependent hydrolase, partial [Betaproteobacteria bacterium]|nr:metal-dependent hydrolase [Betaproteobacteria bacterium]
SWWVLPVFVFVAICPDFDYFAIWLFNYSAKPRISHSILFAVALSLLAWWGTRRLFRRNSATAPLVAFLLAALSHPLLDLLVGVHSVPLLWPLPNQNVSLPGILPSAGRLAPGNYYLWRNLLIESAVLMPVLAFLVALARKVPIRIIARWALFVAPIWLLFLAWSLGLRR